MLYSESVVTECLATKNCSGCRCSRSPPTEATDFGFAPGHQIERLAPATIWTLGSLALGLVLSAYRQAVNCDESFGGGMVELVSTVVGGKLVLVKSGG